MSASHKSRKKRKDFKPLTRTPTTTDIVSVDERSNVSPEFPLVAFLLPARSASQWIVLPLILIFTALFRWVVGFWGYSGSGKPPMHGDFEAQRHWMEITVHLPISQWYYFDLPYWGLDYPPLTAYHSWLCGKVGSRIDPALFALSTSRGLESQLLKVFMRSTVIISEYLIYVPAVIIFLRHYARSQGVGATATTIALVGILMQPATILVDHGHFQYNTVMLGFMVASLSSIYATRLLWASTFFVAALGFKQMALYYAPVMFAYLLGQCLTPHFRPGRLLAIALATLAAFAFLFAPIIAGTVYERPEVQPALLFNRFRIDPAKITGAIALQIMQVTHRCFPFARGLFEDKVANFWCFTNTFFKLRNLQGIIELPRLSAFLTLVSILPSAMVISSSPRKALLPYALASSAFGFFLFSFQVHEKSILLPLLPMTLLLGSKNGLSKEYRAWIGFGNLLGVWTMYPLLRRDELKTPYIIISLLWAYLMGLPPTSIKAYYNPDYPNEPGISRPVDDLWTPIKTLHWCYIVVMACWHLLQAFEEPPADKPDLWVVINACIGAVGFGICYLWCTWKLIEGSGLLDEYFSYRSRERAKLVEKKLQ